jgi:hypothetical protein
MWPPPTANLGLSEALPASLPFGQRYGRRQVPTPANFRVMHVVDDAGTPPHPSSHHKAGTSWQAECTECVPEPCGATGGSRRLLMHPSGPQRIPAAPGAPQRLLMYPGSSRRTPTDPSGPPSQRLPAAPGGPQCTQ